MISIFHCLVCRCRLKDGGHPWKGSKLGECREAPKKNPKQWKIITVLKPKNIAISQSLQSDNHRYKELHWATTFWCEFTVHLKTHIPFCYFFNCVVITQNRHLSRTLTCINQPFVSVYGLPTHSGGSSRSTSSWFLFWPRTGKSWGWETRGFSLLWDAWSISVYLTKFTKISRFVQGSSNML